MLRDQVWPSVFLENHDFARNVSRFGPGDGPYRDAAVKMLALMANTLSGTLFLYQGQEIGMTNVPHHWDISDFRDPVDLDKIEDLAFQSSEKIHEQSVGALALWGRDNGRTPVQWTDGAHAGFSEVYPWIRVNENYSAINVVAQLYRKDSVLATWKQLIQLRKSRSDVLMRGHFHLLDRDNKRVFS
jgi:oligo-1,6-glucosidase